MLWYTGAEREAVGAPPSRSQNCCPDPSNKTCDAVDFFFVLPWKTHENILIVISSQHAAPRYPTKNTKAPLPVQGPHHIVLEVGWIYPSESLTNAENLKMAPSGNRRFLFSKIFRLNVQVPFVQLGVIYDFMKSIADFCRVPSCLAFRSGIYESMNLETFC